jgi:hypothetical protein
VIGEPCCAGQTPYEPEVSSREALRRRIEARLAREGFGARELSHEILRMID